MKRECATCRYYRYLPTLDAHICKGGTGEGEMTAEEVENVTKYGCDAWEPRFGVAG